METNFLQTLPPEMQAEVQKLLRHRKMAEAMQMQSMQGAGPTQVVGGYAVKNSPLQAISQVLTGYMGGKGLEESDKGLADAMGRYQKSTSDEIGALMGSDNPSMYQGSANPRVAAMAAEMMKQREARATKGAEIIGKDDPTGALNVLQSGKLPQQYAPPKLGDPTFGTDPGGNSYALVPEKGGGRKFAYAPKHGATATAEVRMAGKEGEMALDTVKADLKTRQERAEVAKQTLFSTRGALEAINDGAQSGGLEGFKLSVKKVLQGLNVPTENLTTTESLAMALGNQVLAKARSLAPVTGEDVKRLEAILGSVNTDPQALQKMLSITNGIAMKELQDYNRWVDKQSGSLTNPLAKDLLSGAGVGYEMMPPPGNTLQALQAIAELQKRGGDVTNFAVGGEQISPSATFKLGSPKAKAGEAPISLDEYLRRMQGK